MSRRLIGVPIGPPERDQLLIGATPVDDGYAKPYTADDFRSWAQDVDDAHRLMSSDSTGTALHQRLTDDPRFAQTYSRMFVDPNDGIKGSLEEVGGTPRVVLTGGRHRAHYQMQRGWTVAPVWVTSADERVLDEFRDRCHETIRAHDPSLAEAYDHTSAARVERNEERRMGLERDLHRERSFDRWDRER